MNHRDADTDGTTEAQRTNHRGTEGVEGPATLPRLFGPAKHLDSRAHWRLVTLSTEVLAVSIPTGRRLAIILCLMAAGLSSHGFGQAAGDGTVPYPSGYRDWVHVKSALVSARSKDFDSAGGFRHIYANPQAATGYRTGAFPEGSIIVVDWIEGTDTDGAFTEGTRRRLDVMVKDGSRFGATRGWGFERFKGDTRERMVTSVDKQCAACHSGPDARDMVFSKFRP